MNDRRKFNKYIVFWLTQSLSELGSSMTSFALVIWAYGQTCSALSVSLMTFCSYVPFVIVSLFAGSFLDSHKKKSVLLLSDTFAAVCTIAVCLLALWGKLEIWHIYLANILIGFMNAFQSPALSVSLGILVPEEYRSRASGMSSFSSNLITVVRIEGNSIYRSSHLPFGSRNPVFLYLHSGSFSERTDRRKAGTFYRFSLGLEIFESTQGYSIHYPQYEYAKFFLQINL